MNLHNHGLTFVGFQLNVFWDGYKYMYITGSEKGFKLNGKSGGMTPSHKVYVM